MARFGVSGLQDTSGRASRLDDRSDSDSGFGLFSCAFLGARSQDLKDIGVLGLGYSSYDQAIWASRLIKSGGVEGSRATT